MTASKIPGYRQFGVPEYNDDERELNFLGSLAVYRLTQNR